MTRKQRDGADRRRCVLAGGTAADRSYHPPSLSGLPLNNQGLVLDAGFNTLGAVFSDAAAFIIGS